jgi:PAS domain S-box-containing protein
MFGYEPGEFPATYESWVNIIHPNEREKTIESLNKQFKDKLDRFKIEYRVICKDGTEKWILGLAKGNEFDKNGIVTRLIGINLDITETKNLEKQLKLSQYSIENAPEDIIWVTSDARIYFVNETTCKSLGYSKEELTSMSVFDIDPGFPRDKWQSHWEDIKSGKIKKVLTKHQRKNGEKFDVDIALNYIQFYGKEYNCAFIRDISEQKEIEDKLKESQRKLETLMSNLPGMAYRCKNDANWTMEFVSEGCEELTGYSSEDLIDNKKLSYGSLIHPDDTQKVWDEIQLSLSQKIPFQVYYRIIDVNSQTKFILEKGKGIFSDEGELLALEGFMSDLSEQKIAEEKLIESENYLYKIINTISDPVFVKNRDHVWELVNTAFCEFIGHSNEELIGKSDYDFFPEHEADVFWKKDEEVFITKKENINEEKITTSPGHTRTIITKKTIYNDKTGADHLVGVIRDVTDLKNVQKSLKKQYKFLQNLMDSIPNPIFYKDVNYKYRGCNTAFEEVLGISKKSIIGKTVYDLNPPELADKFQEKDQELIETPGTQKYEAPVKFADGTIHEILFVKNTYNDTNGNLAGMIGVMSDITGIRNAEKALKSSEREYREVFENMDTALAVYEAVEDGKNFIIKDFNLAGARIEQVSRKEVIGKKITEAFPGVIEFGLFDVLKKVWKTGTPERFPISFYKDERISGWRENYVYKLASGEVVAVYDDLTEKKQAEEEIILNQNRLKSLVKILQYNPESVQELLDYALKEAIKLTKSKIGYIYHYYPDKEHFILNTWSKGVMEECSVKEAPPVYDLAKTGIWGEAVRQQKSFIINDFKAPNPLKKGYPEGHAPLYKYMTLPVFSRNEIVAVVGVANKEEDYSETDLLQLELLMDAVWKVVDRQKFEEALKISETQYKAIFENTGTATAISEDDMILSLVNEEFCELTGYSKKEIENKMTWTEFFVENQLERMQKYHRLRRVDPEKAPKNYESQVIDKKGAIKDVFMSVSIIPNTKKSLVSVLDITEKRQSRIGLRRELKINQSLARVYVPIISPSSAIEDVADVILKESKELTGSREGFVSSIDPKTGYNIVHTLTKMMPNCKVMLKEERVMFPKGADGKYNGLWGYSLNTGEPLFTNSPENHKASQGVPEGHIKLERFLSVPVFLGKKLVGQIALANSTRNYSQKDIDAVKRIAEFYALAINNKNAEKEIKDSLEEKETLLREIHHRVKNNMQIISSLLNLQKYEDVEKDPLELINDSQNRIKTMSIVHELLYHSERLSEVNLKLYIEKLTYYLFEQFSAGKRKIRLIKDLEENYLNIETAVPCCLIVNELVSNSLKHAFPSGDGEIKILFHRLNGKYELIVKDNGIGLPADFDLKNTTTMGLYLVNSLVKQIDGTLEVKKDDGAEFKIIFEELIYKKRF